MFFYKKIFLSLVLMGGFATAGLDARTFRLSVPKGTTLVWGGHNTGISYESGSDGLILDILECLDCIVLPEEAHRQYCAFDSTSYTAEIPDGITEMRIKVSIRDDSSPHGHRSVRLNINLSGVDIPADYNIVLSSLVANDGSGTAYVLSLKDLGQQTV